MTIEIGKAGGGLPQLAPDLTYPADRKNLNVKTYKEITGIDASGGLTTALSLTGKFAVSLANFLNTTAESMTIKLTIDSVVIWNATFLATSGAQYILGDSGGGNGVAETILCNDSLLLEVQTTADTSINLQYMARPIL